MDALNSPNSPEKDIQTLLELLAEWKLESFELDIIQSLANRERWESSWEKTTQVNSEVRVAWNSWELQKNDKYTAKGLIDQIYSSSVPFLVFWTDGKRPWHNTQYMNFETTGQAWDRWIFDSDGRTPESLKNNTDTVFVELLQQEFGKYKAMRLRVADRRVDHRGWSHTSIVIFLPKTIERNVFEKLAQDTEWLKHLMGSVFEKANSPLKWAESKVTRSFLV